MDIVKESVSGVCLLVVVAGTAQVTLTGLNHHHHPADQFAVSAPETNRHGLGPVRPAAAAVRAGPAELGLEPLQATAACVGQFLWTAGLFCVAALLPFLSQRHRSVKCNPGDYNMQYAISFKQECV